MSFTEIEQRRAKAGIDQKALCAKAGVHEQTYSRLKNRPGTRGAGEATLRALSGALEQLIEERAA